MSIPKIPTLLPLFKENAKINNKAKKPLLNRFEFKSMAEAKKSLGVKYVDEVYTILKEEWNNYAVNENEIRMNKYDEEVKKFINEKYNNYIVNTPFVNTTSSNQISAKFALGEHSIKTRYEDFIKEAETKIQNEFPLFNILNLEINYLTSERLIQKIYNLLMAHRGEFNRIYITNTETGNVISSELKEDIQFNDFERVIEKIIQSAGLAVLGTLTFTIQQRNLPKGANGVDVPEFLKNKRGISAIYNNDNCCGQRCLVLSECKTNDDLRQIKTPKNKLRFDNKTSEMCEKIGIKGEMKFIDFDIYADKERKQIIILSGLFVEMYSTPTEYTEKIYIYHDTAINHYHFIHDINAASNDSKCNNKWCHYCRKSIRRANFNTHKCKASLCSCCRTDFLTITAKDEHFKDAKEYKTWAQCELCNLWCADDECLEKHIGFCKGNVKKCPDCKKWIDNKTEINDDGEEYCHFIDKHICGEKLCSNCKNYYTGEHRCFITKIEPESEQWIEHIYAYDFESMFDDDLNHIVNLCIVKKLYSDEKHIFYNIEDFVKFAVSCKRTTFIAHNGKAYDNWLVHKYIIKHTAHRPNKLILAGNKIMYMKVKSVRFIDSLNHIAQALDTFPKTFGLKELKKGYFPYFFNKAENQNYVGTIPDKKYYNPEGMSSYKYEDFNKWYDLQKDIVYDFKKELYEYCESDVDILKRSLEVYVNNALKVNGINPLRCSTIASYCLKVFRTNFMNEKQIAVLTKEEYDFCKKGFFGGRTEVFKMFKSWSEQDIKEGKYGKYVDIQSLYPSVQFFDDLPCGIPKWDKEPIYDEANINDYINSHYGYIEVDVKCPENLHIPVLPEKKNNKLIFDLVDKEQKVFSSIELQKAIAVGYTITKIYKSLTFDKTDNIFKGYIQTFLKIKTECAGYDKDDIDSYIKRYYESCGVLLEKDKIKKNSGMKLLAKICLNSLWGKFGQNDELPTTAYIKNDAWFKLLQRHSDKKVELKNEILIDDDTLYVSYIEKQEERTSLMTTNLGLAGFVTANARLRLYKELYKLDNRVIYCDTDSIIYEYDKNKYNVTEGDCLGEWELEENGNLTEVYALAPKTYGYKSLDGEEKYKCKGITLNYGNKIHFTYDKLKELIAGENKEKIITYSNDFVKDRKNGNIHTKLNVPKDTNYNIKEFKRIFNEDGTSKPFSNRDCV